MQEGFIYVYNVNMSEDNIVKIIVALIALFGTILGFITGFVARIKKQAIIDARREEEEKNLFNRIFDELEGVKHRLDEHNHYAQKFGKIEKTIVAIQKDIEYIRKDSK